MDAKTLANHLSNGRWAEAETMLAPVALAADAHPSLIYNHGKVLLELARYDQALEQLRRAVQAAPRHDAAWFEVGRAALEIEDLPTALDAFGTAWALVPGDVDARRNLGRVALRLGRYDVARKAWRGFAGDPEADLALYRIAAETGDPASAAMRAKLLAHHPDRAAVLRVLVRVSKGAIPLNL